MLRSFILPQKGHLVRALRGLCSLAAPSTPPLPRGVKPSHVYAPYALRSKWPVNRAGDAYCLRFDMPATDGTGEACFEGPDPRGVKVLGPDGHGGLVSKSYSPVSPAESEGFIDLLVKTYAPPEGALSRFLCDLEVGETADMWVKPVKRGMYQAGLHREVGLLAAGTGLAPLFQLALRILHDPLDTQTKVHLVVAHRREEDIMLKDEVDTLAAEFPDRFRATHVLAEASQDCVASWNSDSNAPTAAVAGHVDADICAETLPPPILREGGGREAVKVYVCGTDQFVESMAGPKVRQEDGSKVDGPLRGALHSIGFVASQVHKF